MESNETAETPGTETRLLITFEARSYLQEAGKWAVFLGVVGFIGCFFILVVAVFAKNIVDGVSALSPTLITTPSLASGVVSGIYGLVCILHFFFSLYLFQFGRKIQKGFFFTNQATVTAAFSKLKSFFKLWGVLTIMLVVFYALVFLVVICIGISAASLYHQ